MGNRVIRCGLVMVATVIIMGLTGCGTNGKNNSTKSVSSKPAVAYMIAHTANAKQTDSSAPMLQDTMIDCAENYGYSFIVRVDGDQNWFQVKILILIHSSRMHRRND